ncbi:MAG: phytanoyl-CoA dioxygenase family protein [Ferrovibrio sp.]|uniref:phytanoyl-CoA dioxygenase family protein n=1 Tax=Ferrovibrio sp. TaxID=1917215 RepID=UPI00261B0538|nr:phytanoyl-CoA dioxygenase family protein [Ferrovibrio sp.]MCW0235365.1 phytanoyl-CoA dioxygenase family protein [Ferrovibrio sp.]
MEKMVVRDVSQYFRAELARKYRSTAGSQEQVDPALIDVLMAEIERDGYVILENLFSADEAAAMRAALQPHYHDYLGRNSFEGFGTKRLYAVIEKTLACNPLVEHPVILALLDRIFEPNYLLSQLQAIDILPGEAAQPPHHDDAFYRVSRPRAALGAATIMAIDDFTAENGATLLIPGSHKWDDRMPTAEETARAVPAVMPSGSVLFFIGTLWHGGGANVSSASRLCVTAQYCAPWCRQQENFSLSVSRERVKQCSEHVRRMLGYSIHPPFMGFVNGLHPKRLLED